VLVGLWAASRESTYGSGTSGNTGIVAVGFLSLSISIGPWSTPSLAQTTLPPLEVEAPKAKPKQAKRKSAAPAPAAKSSTASDSSQPSQPEAETAAGPVNGYLAEQSATGTKTDTPLREIPQSISVVGAEQIRDQGAQTVQDTLRYVPGVVADAYGLDSRTDTVIVRGTEATEYLDGLRRTFNYYSYNYRIDPYFLERLEILRGPASVLYGQAAVGGILNSVSKRPQERESREVTVEYGTHDFKQVKTDMTGKLTEDGKWLYRIVALGRDADTQVDYVEDDRLALAPSITYRPQVGTSLTLMGHFQKDHTGSTSQFLPHLGTIFPTKNGFIPRDRFVGEPGDRYDTEVASGTLLFEHKINETFKLSHNMRYADIHNDYQSSYAGFFTTGHPYVSGFDFSTPVPTPIPDPTERTMARIKWASITDTQIFNSDTNLEAKFDTGPLRHRVLGGVDHASFRAKQRSGSALNLTLFDVFDPVYGQPESLLGTDCQGQPIAGLQLCRSDQEVSQTGLYLQDQIRLGRWIAVIGARHDWIENSTDSATQKDQASTYRAGLMYELPSGLTPYVSYAQSFVPVVGLTFDGKPFDPQKGEMVEVGFKYQFPGANFVINSAVYDIKESNRLAGDPGNPGFSVQTGAVAIRGFEIEALGKVTQNLRLIASYSYTDAEYAGGDQKGFRVESVPRHLAALWSIYTFNEGPLNGFSIGAGVRYIGSSWDGKDSLETPAVTLFDGMIAYNTKDWRWSLNVYNIEDERYFSTCLFRGDCWFGQGRTITTAFTYRF
jgi:iron complex outermembrane recepter protein